MVVLDTMSPLNDDSSMIPAIILISSNDSSGDIFKKIGFTKFIIFASV